jgi:putative hydrolase of the HAD superfamily
MKEIKWMVFDYGGVISKKQNQEHIKEMCALLRISESDFLRFYLAYRFEYDTALLDIRTYWEKTGRLAGKIFTASELDKIISLDIASWLEINPGTVGYIKAIRDKISLALLSNMTFDTLSIIKKAGWFEYFQKHVFSCEERVGKPDKKIFSILLERLDAESGSVLFIDDSKKNTESAKDMGMHVLHFIDDADMIKEIEADYLFSR